MSENLRRNIDKFYDVSQGLDVFGIADLATLIVPQLDKLITELEVENKKLRDNLLQYQNFDY